MAKRALIIVLQALKQLLFKSITATSCRALSSLRPAVGEAVGGAAVSPWHPGLDSGPMRPVAQQTGSCFVRRHSPLLSLGLPPWFHCTMALSSQFLLIATGQWRFPVFVDAATNEFRSWRHEGSVNNPGSSARCLVVVSALCSSAHWQLTCPLNLAKS